MIFSDSPQQKALERMMTAVPRFLPQGGGITQQKCATAGTACITAENAQLIAAPASRNESLPEQQTDPR